MRECTLRLISGCELVDMSRPSTWDKDIVGVY